MSLPVRLTPAAEADLLAHYRYIAQHNPTAAERFFDSVEGFLTLVAGDPKIGVDRDCGRAGRLRMFPVPRFRNWLIFYSDARDQVLVVRILHAKQDLPGLFAE